MTRKQYIETDRRTQDYREEIMKKKEEIRKTKNYRRRK